MTIGVGILIAAVGAVLAFAVTGEVSGVDVQTAGVIIMITGLVITFIAAVATMSRRRVRTAPAAVGYRRTNVVEVPVAARSYPAAPVGTAVVDQPVDSAQI
jgi:hypothetical protein